MGMKFTQIPANTYKELQLNAGVLLSDFNPATAELDLSGILGATDGGVNVTATPTYIDLANGIDNSVKNTKEGKELDSWEFKLSGTFKTVTTALAKKLLGAADVSSTDTTKVTPRTNLSETDFFDVWWVGDYSDKHTSENGGFIAIHLVNALSTGGFSIQSAEKDKGAFAAEFTAHASAATPEVCPFEIYIKAGTGN